MKKKKSYIIIGIAAFVLVITGIVLSMVMSLPDIRFKRAVANMGKELLAYQNPALNQIDTTLLKENMRKTPHTVDSSITLTFPQNEDLDNLNFSIQTGIDYGSRQASMDFGLGAYHINLIRGNITVDDTQLYFSLPKLLKDTYAVKLDTFGADYNASEWSYQLGIDIDEDIAFDLFTDQEENMEETQSLMNALEDDLVILKDSILMDKTPDKANVTRDGRNMKCSGVAITIPKDAMNSFLDRFQEEFKAGSMYQELLKELTEGSATAYIQEEDIQKMVDAYVDDILGIRCNNDIVIYLYMDSKSRIVRITTPSAVEFKDSELKGIQITADLTGTKRTLDVIDGQIKAETLDGKETLAFKRNAEITETDYDDKVIFDYIGIDNKTVLTVCYDNSWDLENLEFDGSVLLAFPDANYELSADGSYHDIVSGESYALDLDTVSLEVDEKAILRIAGDVSVSPGIGEIVVPEQSVAFFDMDSSAIYNMLYEIISSVQAQVQSFY